MSSPFRFLLFVLLAVVAVKVSEQLYGLVAHREHRALAGELRGRLLDTGAELVELRHEADSLRRVIEGEDEALERDQRVLRRFHRSARQGLLNEAERERYGEEVDRYNLHVVSRNAVLRDYEGVQERQKAASDRYNAIADSLHALAVRMRRPYYQVPTPLEAADERRRISP
jgi:hypothetical protein